jgi:hypothetical protein
MEHVHMARPPLILAVSIVALWVARAQPASKPVTESGKDIFAPLGPDIARLRFHTGGVKNNQPEISPVLPDIPGQASPWFVTQWSHHEFLVPDVMTRNDPATRDAVLGSARYAFTTPDKHSHVWIYQMDHRESVYELYEEGGELGADGGSNIFLSADEGQDGVSLDHEINYQLNAKLSDAEAEYRTPTAKASGAVLAQIFTGFIIRFPNPRNGADSTLFLQISHAASKQIADYRACSTSGAGLTIIYGNTLPGDATLRYSSNKGPMKHLDYSLNKYLCDLIDRPLKCTGGSNEQAAAVTLAGEVRDFRRWKLLSIYVGLETEAKDVRPQSTNRERQGDVAVAMQLSALHVREYPDRSFAPADCSKFH